VDSQKVRTRYEATPELSDTLQKLVTNEQGEKKRTATEGLMWLVRGLSFTCKGLMKAQADKKQELSAAFGESYGETLKQYHNFVVKGVFAVRFSMFSNFMCYSFKLNPHIVVVGSRSR
jgi:hypothetical protein